MKTSMARSLSAVVALRGNSKSTRGMTSPVAMACMSCGEEAPHSFTMVIGLCWRRPVAWPEAESRGDFTS
ncbi:hypothetical protein D3C72_2379870 [compost metagenome]